MKDYVKYLTYGFTVAASFIWLLHEPDPPIAFDNMMENDEQAQKALDIMFARGGEVLDIELAEILQHIYDLSQMYKIDIFAK